MTRIPVYLAVPNHKYIRVTDKSKESISLNGSSRKFLEDFRDFKRTMYELKQDVHVHLAESAVEKTTQNEKIESLSSWLKLLVGALATLVISLIATLATLAQGV